jgi:serine/threonine protein kinase
LKPENVLVGKDGYAKLTDFGLAKENVSGHSDAKSLCGTAEYLSPEILMRQGHGKASDWWSFGAIIYEMLCGSLPSILRIVKSYTRTLNITSHAWIFLS